MKITKSIILLITTANFYLISPAIAGDNYSMDGLIKTQDSSEAMPVDDNHILMKLSNSGTITLNDEKNPMHGATGSCSATVLVAMGKLNGSGYCSYKDSSGDSAIVSFSASSLNDKGGTNGSWEIVGGTGKYAKATGSGEYSSVPNAEQTESMNTLVGNIEIM